MVAADKGFVDTAEFLIEQGADLNIKASSHGMTALMCANSTCVNDNREIRIRTVNFR